MSVLSAVEVRKRIDDGWIFKEGTYDTGPDGFWIAKYNLRVGTKFMVIPDGSVKGRAYDGAKTREDPFALGPGETALVSTLEEIRMPWDLTAIVGPKFSIARRGLLVLTGFVVDPGFGQRWDDEQKRWVAKDEEHLYFLVANLSKTPQTLIPGRTRLAAIQFMHVEGAVEEEAVDSTEDTIREFFEDDGLEKAGLAFFRELSSLSDELGNFKIRFGAMERGTTNLIFFGVFLLSVTVLAAAVSVILTLVSNDRVQRLNNLPWESVWKALALAGGSTLVLCSAIFALWLVLRIVVSGRSR